MKDHYQDDAPSPAVSMDMFIVLLAVGILAITVISQMGDTEAILVALEDAKQQIGDACQLEAVE